MTVGQAIRARRIALHMSQQELADALGYRTRSTIAKIESGENDVSRKKLAKFAAVLGTTVEALLQAAPGGDAVRPLSTGSHRCAALVLAGGWDPEDPQGIPAQFRNVRGKPVLVYSLEAYQSHPAIDEIHIVCLSGWENIVRAYASQYGITKLRGLYPGGSTGLQSLKLGFDRIAPRFSGEDLLVIQESTRPMVTAESISVLLHAADRDGSATFCHSMREYVQFDLSSGAPRYADRNAMIALQSPEAHRFRLLEQVFRQAQRQQLELTQSCCTMLLHQLGFPIHFLESSINNIKIAGDADLAAFGALVK